MASGAIEAVRGHWPEYLIEAAGLALFMISAGAFGTLLEYPQSPVHGMLPDPLVRRALMGIAMGATAIGLIYSPWGRQSGAHFNPAVTLAFSRLGKVAPWDGVFYVIAQFVGGLAGVLAISAVLGNAFREPPVEFVVTVPGFAGPLITFLAEFAISCGLMLAVLYTSNRIHLMRYTGLFAGALLAGYITVEAPFSGTSMNPARTVASAALSGVWDGVWIYFSAPLLGMLIAV
ncbi:MAG TPA: aquaporin, partial [Bradyrhizobium sp.]|nr:aquaporin [Bradyrhizobium sp.]